MTKLKNGKKIDEICNIFCVSLEKYKNNLSINNEKNNKKKVLKYISSKNIKNIHSYILLVENINKIKLKYKIDEFYNKYNDDKNEYNSEENMEINENINKIKIFGDLFVENNRDKCYIIYNRIKFYLNDYFYIINNKAKKLVIELVGIRNITNLSEMFLGCQIGIQVI